MINSNLEQVLGDLSIELSKKFENIKKEVEREMEKQVLKTHADVVLATPVQSGRLRASIEYKKDTTDNKNISYIIGTNVEYAPYVEFGTYKMAPRYFMRKGYYLNREEFVKQIGKAVDRGLGK